MDELMRRRLAHNEQLFRQINNEIEIRNADADGEMAFVCECSNRACLEKVHLTAREYARIRREPRHYVLVQGHDVVALERVVERTGTYEVVEKREAA